MMWYRLLSQRVYGDHSVTMTVMTRTTTMIIMLVVVVVVVVMMMMMMMMTTQIMMIVTGQYAQCSIVSAEL